MLTYFLLRYTQLSIGPVSFPIISIVKWTRKRVLIEFSALAERYWRLLTETFGTYSLDAAEKLKLIFKLQPFHSFWLRTI